MQVRSKLYSDDNYAWIAPPDKLKRGELIPRFRIALLNFTVPGDHKPAPQKALSILTGIPESRLSEYAMGKRRISASNLLKLCDVMRCTPDDLIGVEESE